MNNRIRHNVETSFATEFSEIEVALLSEFKDRGGIENWRVLTDDEHKAARNLKSRKIVEVSWIAQEDDRLPLKHGLHITNHGELMMAVYELGIQIRNLMNRR
jgi:hypothetical protein